MGQKNTAMCNYLEVPEHFADFMNAGLFDGRQVISPEQLMIAPGRLYTEGTEQAGQKRKLKGERDVTKYLRIGEKVLILALENQDEIHFAMPFRCMKYDVMDYDRQLRWIAGYHQGKKDLQTGAEYLSGFGRQDRLYPIVSVVFYHGEEEWMAGRDLYGMIDFEGYEFLKPLAANYKMNLITLSDLKEDKLETGLREIVGMMKCRRDKQKMQRYVREHAERF